MSWFQISTLVRVACRAAGVLLVSVSCREVTWPAPVASVELRPSRITMDVNERVQLGLTVRDSTGAVLEGGSLRWGSNDTTVALVTSDGAVTSVGFGTSVVTAIAGDRHGSTEVHVVPGGQEEEEEEDPIEFDGEWPHAPTGWPVLADQPGDADVPALSDGPWVDGWGIAANTLGLVTTISDVSGPQSPGRVIQVRYPAGFIGGAGPGEPYRSLPNVTQVYVGAWWKISDGWQTHLTGSDKIQYLRFAGSGDLLAMIMHHREVRVMQGLTSTGVGSTWLNPNVKTVRVSLGEWHLLEWRVEYTPGGDGRIRWWLDGALIGDYPGIRFPATQMNEYQLNSVWGGVGDIKLRDDYFWYDHVRVLGR